MVMSESQVPQDSGQVYQPGQHPDLPPPAGTVGVIGWLRQNLFSGPVNAIATVIAALVIYSVVVPIANWVAVDAVVSGEDRRLCDLGRTASLIGSNIASFDAEDFALDPDAPGLSEEAAAAATVSKRLADSAFDNIAGSLAIFLQRYEAMPPELIPDSLGPVMTEVRPADLLPELQAAVAAGSVAAAEPLFTQLQPLVDWGGAYDGACWVVIKQRWVLFMTGFYDRSENWRPLLAGIGLVFAVAPLLFTSLPYRKPLLYFAAAYPFFAYYLLTGVNLAASPMRLVLAVVILIAAGAIVWMRDISGRPRLLPFAYVAPLLAMLVLFGFSGDRPIVDFEPVTSQVRATAEMAAQRDDLRQGDLVLMTEGPVSQFTSGRLFLFGFGLAPLWWLACVAIFGLGLSKLLKHAAGRTSEVEWRVWAPLTATCSLVAAFLLFLAGQAVFEGVVLIIESTDKWGGLLATLVSGVVGITASLPIGVVLALGRRSKMPIVRMLCVSFIELVRGVPLITILFMSSVMLPLFLPEGVNFDKFLRALIGVALFASAYMAEVVRGGLQAIPKGQYEAADAIGLTYAKSMRLIVLPQALKIVIPGIVNTFIGLFKDTTLLGIIGILDLLQVARSTNTDAAWIGFFEETYAFVGIVFFVFCFGMSRYSIYLEGKLETGHRRR